MLVVQGVRARTGERGTGDRVNGDRGPLEMTLSRSEVLAARNGSTNGSIPSTSTPRRCEACGSELTKPSQKRACSSACGRVLGARVKGERKARRVGNVPTNGTRSPSQPATTTSQGTWAGVVSVLASLPNEVTGVTLAGGWTITRAT